MFRYVALVWDDADPIAQHDARALTTRLQAGGQRWECVLRCAGIEVFCRDVRPGSSEPYRLHGDSGVVLGKLFARGRSGGSSVAAPLNLSEDESTAVVSSGGRRLVERYWGRYVAILKDAASGTSWVLRDPSGSLPCFTTRIRAVEVFLSHMEEGALLADGAFSISWKYVAAAICQSRMQIEGTGLNEVSQVLGGQCVTLREGKSSRQFYWNLLSFAGADPIEDSAEAASLLREQTLDCVHAWASSYQSIVLLLSGGLDSSIVLACLKEAPCRPRVTCLNFHSPGSDTDERVYARLAAEGSGYEVVERLRHPTLTLEPLQRIQKACIPSDYFFYLDGGRHESEVAAEHGASAVFSGYGGDALFYQAYGRLAAADYLTRHGPGAAWFTVALDVARMDRISFWQALQTGVLHSLSRRRWDDGMAPHRYRTLVPQQIIHDITADPALQHPWFHTPGRVASGKLFHAYQLIFPLDFYHPLGAEADPEHVTPLYSQPLLELAMRIPTWLLTLGGWDRAMARRAFQHKVPRRIVARRTKGSQDDHAKSILTRDLKTARELLLQGQLVREGLLDKNRTGEALSGKPSRIGANNTEMFAYLSVEAWLRQWHAA